MLILQLGISILLLGLLLRRIPLHQFLTAFARVRPTSIVSAIVLSLIGYWGRAYRWSALLARAGVKLPVARSYCITLIGICYGLVTPGRVGEFARILHLRLPQSQILPSVVWDRIFDVLLLEAMTLPAFLFFPQWRGPLMWLFLGVVGLSIVAVLVVDHPPAISAIGRSIPWLAKPIGYWSRASSGTLRSPALLSGLAGGLFFYLFSYASAWLLLRDLAPGASPLLYLSLPIIPLLGNLPFTLGGLGLREHVSATVFGQLGLGIGLGPAFSLLWFSTTTLTPGLVGLVLSVTPLGRAETSTLSPESHP
ncbi:MAG: lysylphosphatidylglycerol synthase transmembrane domain-containing protein [Candidatus Eisenbacteria bacterium]